MERPPLGKHGLHVTIGELVSGGVPRQPPPYRCNWCGRDNLRDWHAAMQHVAARHTEELMHTVTDNDVSAAVSQLPATDTSEIDELELALIMVCNAESLDAAIAIATNALLGGKQ